MASISLQQLRVVEDMLQQIRDSIRDLELSHDSCPPVRTGWAAAAKQAHADGEEKLMVADVFEDEAMEDWKW